MVEESFVRSESARCLQCYDAPCASACPAGITIPRFIRMLQSGNYQGAAEVVRSCNPLVSICSAVCPTEELCHKNCTRGKLDNAINIRELHDFASKNDDGKPIRFESNKRVAIVGAGPCGLACAFELRKLGIMATVFDEEGEGGVPSTQLPKARLDERRLKEDLGFLRKFGVKVQKKKVKTDELESLKKEYGAVFLAVGAQVSRKLGIPGEEARGCYPASEFLKGAKDGEITHKGIGDDVVIIGGGNVALDAACVARSLGSARVTVAYRRSRNEMPAWKAELEDAIERGVEFAFQRAPVKLVVNCGKVTGIVLQKMELKGKDSSGRPKPVPIVGSDYEMSATAVISAIGQEAPSWPVKMEGGKIVVSDFKTSIEGIFAGGDAINGGMTISQAVGDGRVAAQIIAQYLGGA